MTFFNGLFDTSLTSVISVGDFLVCMISALVMGIVLSFFYKIRNRATKSFSATMILLPAVVSVVIMLVNGNIGLGVAVAGTFSLMKFRSQPGSGKEIAALFMAMGAGMLCGMGYIGYAVLYTLLLGGVLVLINLFSGHSMKRDRYRTLRITIPEDLDYTTVFDGILKKYARSYDLTQVKTTNLGSMYRLAYDLELRPEANEKNMIDELRIRNGNLEISVSRLATENESL